MRIQQELAAAVPQGLPSEPSSIGGCFVCFERGGSGPGHAGDAGWAGVAAGGSTAVAHGEAPAAYAPGLLALREGPLLEAAVRALPGCPASCS